VRAVRDGRPTGCASWIGNESTHWRTGTRGMTQSTRWAALCAMRRAPQEGQNPRRLHEKATSFSWPQSSQRKRTKPWARMPHSRKASNSSLINSGKLAPVLSLDLCQEALQVFLDHLIQRRFFGTPAFVVDFVCSRRGRKHLAHDRFLLLFSA